MTNSDPLVGPKLKIARAKSHLTDFENTILEFQKLEPYEVFTEIDHTTGENVYRIKIKHSLPPQLSVIVGDVVHNLRSALDQMVCSLVRANRKQVSGSNGFPIMGSEKSFDQACVGKLKNVPVNAARLIRKLKPYKGGNDAFWMLSELDNLDKHNAIVPVLLGNLQLRLQMGLPFMSISPEGGLALGSAPDGFVPFGHHLGFVVPEGQKPFPVIRDGCEFYRSRPTFPFVEDVGFMGLVSFGKTQVTNNEPIPETLDCLVKLVERVTHIVERRVL